jgi:hypothetical protein
MEVCNVPSLCLRASVAFFLVFIPGSVLLACPVKYIVPGFGFSFGKGLNMPGFGFSPSFSEKPKPGIFGGLSCIFSTVSC